MRILPLLISAVTVTALTLNLAADTPRSLAPGDTFTVEHDAVRLRSALRYTGDATDKSDANDGRNGDNPLFRRHNVARASASEGGYWYTSKHQDADEPEVAGEQWVDYVPPLAMLGAGRYRVVADYRSSKNRATAYEALYHVHTALGVVTLRRTQAQGERGTSFVLGEFDLDATSFVRVEDPGVGSIAFGDMHFTRLAPAADTGNGFRALEPVPVFRSLDLALSARTPGANPYLDGPTVQAVFTGIAGEAAGLKFEIAGFWDGGDIWRVRFAPPVAGWWRVETRSADPGLGGFRGEFAARAGTPAEVARNPLRRGFLTPSGRTFTLSDGSPFLPAGDNLWSFSEELRDDEWRGWMNVLQQRGLNSFMGMAWLGIYKRAELAPFRDYDPATDELSPAYFQRLDRWIAYANDRGILVGLGLGGFPGNSRWWDRFKTRDREDRYFSYLIARYAAFNVRWLLYGECDEASPPWGVTWDQEVRYKAGMIKTLDPYRHPIGNHHRTADLATIDSPDIDYICYQDSIKEQDLQSTRAHQYAAASFGKPVWSEEFWYEPAASEKEHGYSVELGTRNLHLNFLAGLAFPTIGSRMRAHANQADFPPTVAAADNVSLESYLLAHDPGLARFGAFGRFYAGLPFDRWSCVDFDVSTRHVAARFGDSFVVYLPAGESRTLDLTALPGSYRVSALVLATDEIIDLGCAAGGAPLVLALPAGRTSEAVVKVAKLPL